MPPIQKTKFLREEGQNFVEPIAHDENYSVTTQGPSPWFVKIRALEFKGEFQRFGSHAVSLTIGISRLIFGMRCDEPL